MYPDFVDLQQQAGRSTNMATTGCRNCSGGRGRARDGLRVSSSDRLFGLLRVAPAIGRGLSPATICRASAWR